MHASLTVIGHYLLDFPDDLGAREPWSGGLDDMQIWSIPLSESEILDYLNCPPPPNTEGLIAHWDFDEGQGDSVVDLSGNGFHGTLINGTIWSGDPPFMACAQQCSGSDSISVDLLSSGCIDDYACNYDSMAECDDGSCDYSCCPGPGCCSEGTTWNWQTSVCETVLCDSVYNPDVDLDNFIGLQDILAILSYYNASWPPWQCGDPLEYQGYDYETVQIGEQCWFAENLRAENYGNGEAIPADLSDSEWTGTTEGAVSVYDGDMANLCTYGRLYNWYAVHDDRSLCPNNWSVPLDSDWLSLEVTLGMSNVEAATSGYRGSDQGMRMKATSTWADDGNGSNLTGFNAVGAGIKFDSGNYDFQGEYCYWWVRDTIVTVGTENEMYRELFKGSSQVGRGVNAPSNYGYSIRCIKD